MGEYSGLYQFTLVIIGFWVTLRRLKLSLDIDDKTVNTVTLEQCNYYLTDIQVSFSLLIEDLASFGYNVKWAKLDVVTRENILLKYGEPTSAEIDNFLRSNKAIVLKPLYQLEAFSALFLKGNLNKELAYDVIGVTYDKQIGKLLGIITIARS